MHPISKKVFNHIYHFSSEFKVQPKKEHYGCAIRYISAVESREGFVTELACTANDWAYSSDKIQKIIDSLLTDEERLEGNAYRKLNQIVKQKFRKDKHGNLYQSGQFGELLLFNMLLHLFNAIPVLRKLNITTSEGHERFGADAIHYKLIDSTHNFFLGEAKAYVSKYKFCTAFSDAVSSVLKTLNHLQRELNLYLYDDFIDGNLLDVTRKFKNNELDDVEINMVCIICYEETKKVDGKNQDEIHECIEDIIKDRMKSIEDSFFTSILHAQLLRLHYIIFPVWDLDGLISDFERSI